MVGDADKEPKSRAPASTGSAITGDLKELWVGEVGDPRAVGGRKGEEHQGTVTVASAAGDPKKTCKGMGEDHVAKLRPLYEKASHDANKAMDEIKKLHEAACLLKAQNIPLKITSISKVDALRATTADLKLLALRSEECTTTAATPPPSLAYHYTEPFLKGRRRGPAEKKRGFELVTYRGRIAIPTCSLSGNLILDGMNVILFEVYVAINTLLEGAGSTTLFTVACVGKDGRADQEKDRKDAVNKLRSTGSVMRRHIIEVGGLPHLEPLESWRKNLDRLSMQQ